MKTTVKLKLRESLRTPGRGVLVFHIIRHRRERMTTTPYKLATEEWDEKKQEILINESIGTKRRKELISMRRQLNREVREMRRTIENLHADGVSFSASDIIQHFRDKPQSLLFVAYIYKKVDILREVGSTGTADIYKYTANSFLKFLGGKDLHIDKITPALIESYERHLRSNKLKPNTVSSYMRTLRALYNAAVREKLIPDKKDYPFSNVFTGNASTQKRAINIPAIQKIYSLNLEEITGTKTNKEQSFKNLINPLEFSRDLFIFSFFAQGMSFIDIINLKEENITDGYIRYYRKKTGQLIVIKLEDCIRQIIIKYKSGSSGYIFPTLSEEDDPVTRHRKTKVALSAHNRHLKKLAEMAGIREKLTSYVSRHSWATIASREGIPLPVISQGMGHESEKTTSIYIAQVDNTEVGRANHKILLHFIKQPSRTASPRPEP